MYKIQISFKQLNYLITFDTKGLKLIHFMAFTLKYKLIENVTSAQALFKILCVSVDKTISVESMVNGFNKSLIKINQKE